MSSNVTMLKKAEAKEKSESWHDEDTIKVAFENADRVLINRDGIREARENEPFADGIMFRSAPLRSIKRADGDTVMYRMMIATPRRNAVQLCAIKDTLADVASVEKITENVWIVETDDFDIFPRIASTCMDVYYG